MLRNLPGSFAHAIDYDESTLTLTVYVQRPGQVRYFDVPRATIDSWEAAGFSRAFYDEHIAGLFLSSRP